LDDIGSRLAVAVADALGISHDQVTLNLGLGTVEQWDSLGHFRVILAVESAFDIQFTMDQIPQLINIQELKDAVSDATGAE
jgi:acyl carrier protein